MAISPGRKAAFDALLRIEGDGALSSTAIATWGPQLDGRDRGLAHNLVMTVLRNEIPLDREIDLLTDGRKLDSEVRVALRLGLAQLRYFDRVPDHPAINESVELVRRARKSSATSLVNAVLRKASKGEATIEFRDEIDRASFDTSHPKWLLEKWIDDLGYDGALATAKANNAEPRVAFRLTENLPDPDELALIEGFSRSKYVEGCFVETGFSEELRQLESAGKIYFQDEASQLVAKLAARCGGERVLDLCASPGGKTGILADQAFSLIAGDLSQGRADLLRRNLLRQGIDRQQVCRYDAEAGLPFSDGTFDTVLADVPCSGTGTIRHNPEIRYRLTAGDLTDISDKQLRIASNASKLLRPGGSLIYSTCSLEREENEFVVFRLLENEPNLRLKRPDIAPVLVTPEGFVRTTPRKHDMDGFFAAIIERVG